MRRTPVLVVVLLLLLAPMGTATAKSRVPSKATWERQNARIMRDSVTYLQERVDRAKPGERLALNLDIDNTSLATYYARGTAVKPTLELALAAQEMGVAVLFNTARPVANLPRATRILKAAGFPVDDICGAEPGVGVVPSKKACRRGYVADGYTLVINVGNRPTDFRGGDYEKAYKLRSYGGRLG